MAKVRVSFSVAPKTYCEELYIVGSTSSLGYWDVKKATKLKYCEECQKFVVTKFLPAEEVVEFKFITAKDWNNVEKGIWNVMPVEKGDHGTAIGLFADKEENNYLQFNDFLKTFNNREVDSSNMDSFDTWLKEYNNYWFKDGSVYIDNTLNTERIGQHIGSEVIEISDYVLLSGGDGSSNNPYEVKYGS